MLKPVDVIGGKHTLTHKPVGKGFRVERGARGDKKLCDGVLESDLIRARCYFSSLINVN